MVPAIKSTSDTSESVLFWDSLLRIKPLIPATRESSNTTSWESKRIFRNILVAPDPLSIASKVSMVAAVPATAAEKEHHNAVHEAEQSTLESLLPG